MRFFSQCRNFSWVRLAWLAAGVMLAAGCQSSPSIASTGMAPVGPAASTGRPAAQQLMIKLKHAQRSCDASAIAALAAATGETLTYLRPMSGNACVVSHTAKDKALLQDGLRRLASHHAVEWAEIDAIVRTY